MRHPEPRTPPSTSWEDLAWLVAELAERDDPRLPGIVLALEAAHGCERGPADRSPVVMARRFARVHTRATHEATPPTHCDLAN